MKMHKIKSHQQRIKGILEIHHSGTHVAKWRELPEPNINPKGYIKKTPDVF